MKQIIWKGIIVFIVTALGLGFTSSLSIANNKVKGSVPDNFDNFGKKVFSAQQQTPTIYLTSDSGGRNLSGYYELRQYPGSPPYIPHQVDLSFSPSEPGCLSCHGKGGFSQEHGAFAPVTPHPEYTLCSQCHAQVRTEGIFVESDWKSVAPPRLGLSSLSSSPPAIPHELQLRENCIACHTGPGAVTEIRVDHAARGDCRQCHAAVPQSRVLSEFKRN